jgi:transposase
MRVAPRIDLTVTDRAILERWARGRSTPARLVLRAKIVLSAAEGQRNRDIARDLRCTQKTVCLWRRRFAELGISGIEKDAKRGATISKASEALVRSIIHTTLNEPPPNRSHWSTRSLAAALGTSAAMVQRVWKKHGLKAR